MICWIKLDIILVFYKNIFFNVIPNNYCNRIFVSRHYCRQSLLFHLILLELLLLNQNMQQ